MKIKLLISALSLTSLISFGQTDMDSTVTSATKRVLFSAPKSFAIGSYGEAHYNQGIENGTFQNGTADLHRIILFMGYRFNTKLQFFSEIEFEHVNELSVEQAYMNYSFNSALNFKAGVILIPMGVVNEFHEPTLFNGVERPSVDKHVLPTTWREMGAGFHGIIKKANLKYQLYMVNGFKGYDGSAKLSGSSGLRSGRQNATNTLFRTPSVVGKLTYYGINGLRIGISGYHGNSETSMYHGLDRADAAAIATADSTIVGISMASINANYAIKNVRITAVGVFTNISNTDQYNGYTGANVGSQIMGYYGEFAYNIGLKESLEYPRITPFVRYENYNTQHTVAEGITRNDAYQREILTSGIGFQPTQGTVFKADFQWLKNGANARPTNMLNLGFGYWF